MALIPLGDGDSGWIWADGYIPEAAEAAERARQRFGSREFRLQYQGIDLGSADEVFSVALMAWPEYFAHREAFLFTPGQNRDRRSNFGTIWDEYLGDTDPNYRFLILRLGPVHTGPQLETALNLLFEIGFKVKEPSQYQNYTAFALDARGVGDMVLEIYDFPSSVTERRLTQRGFSGRLGEKGLYLPTRFVASPDPPSE